MKRRTEAGTLLEQLVELRERDDLEVAPAEAQLVGECIDERHPTLQGRVLVRLQTARGGEVERWLPTLRGLAIREGDRVLLIKPANWSEAIVTGVVDGFAPRARPTGAAATLSVKSDEALRVVDHNDQPLAELRAGEHGPVVRILNRDSEIELDGELRLSARAIALRARQGEVRVDASADVVVQGETIHLN
jgi:hypothetical protein